MKLYCMCAITGVSGWDNEKKKPMKRVLDNQVYLAPNRYHPDHKLAVEGFPAVILSRAMRVLKNGVKQMVFINRAIPNLHPLDKKGQASDRELLMTETKQHHPNVDIHHCTRCGAIIAVGS